MEELRPCNLEIKQLRDNVFSVKMDGREISQYITGFSLTVAAGKLPVFSMTLAAITVSLSTQAVHDIPQLYKWVLEAELEKRKNALELGRPAEAAHKEVGRQQLAEAIRDVLREELEMRSDLQYH